MLVAGPCVSEFGWELCEWQGRVRKLARPYDKIVVCSTIGHLPLYADMNPTFIPHLIAGRRDCHRMRPGSMPNLNEFRIAQDSVAQMVAELKAAGHVVDRIDSIPKGGKAVGTRRPIERQSFIKYGNPARISEPYPIVIHARARTDNERTSGDNYPRAEWEELLRLLAVAGFPRVAAVGLRSAAIVPTGAADLRGWELRLTMDLMAAATVVIGPSSGPMHLASLCGTPHMVWATDRHQSAIMKRNKERYESYWNPLKTPVSVLLHKSNQVLPPSQLASAVLALISTVRSV